MGLSCPGLSTSLSSYKSSPRVQGEELAFCKLTKEIPEAGKVAACTDVWHLLPGSPFAHPACLQGELPLEWQKVEVFACGWG